MRDARRAHRWKLELNIREREPEAPLTQTRPRRHRSRHHELGRWPGVDPVRARPAGARRGCSTSRSSSRAGEVAARATLPSFLYFPTPGERRRAARLALPWAPAPAAGRRRVRARPRRAGPHAAGRRPPSRGSRNPGGRPHVAHPAVGRRRASPQLSPVDASARLPRAPARGLEHALRRRARRVRWSGRTVVLTVPASFDEEARELTLEAARAAGLERLTLLEEPLAALLRLDRGATARRSRRASSGGELLLVCDVGGGTTDFSLITRPARRGARSLRADRDRRAPAARRRQPRPRAGAALSSERLAGGRRALTLVQRHALRRRQRGREGAPARRGRSRPRADHRARRAGAGWSAARRRSICRREDVVER